MKCTSILVRTHLKVTPFEGRETVPELLVDITNGCVLVSQVSDAFYGAQYLMLYLHHLIAEAFEQMLLSFHRFFPSLSYVLEIAHCSNGAFKTSRPRND